MDGGEQWLIRWGGLPSCSNANSAAPLWDLPRSESTNAKNSLGQHYERVALTSFFGGTYTTAASLRLPNAGRGATRSKCPPHGFRLAAIDFDQSTKYLFFLLICHIPEGWSTRKAGVPVSRGEWSVGMPASVGLSLWLQVPKCLRSGSRRSPILYRPGAAVAAGRGRCNSQAQS